MDEKTRRVTIEGTRYGGAAQQIVTSFGNSKENLLRMAEARRRRNRADKKPPSSDNMAEPKSPKGSLGEILLVDVGRIQWILVNEERYLEINSRNILQVIKEKGLSQRFWPYRSLYTDMATRIRRLVKSNRIEPRARFIVTATGADPTHKKEFGTFIKLSVSKNEFIVPNSFSRDFKTIILKSFP